MAQWLEHWTFDQEVLGSNPVGVESFSAIPYFSSLRFSCRKMGLHVRDWTLFRQKLALRLINDDFLEMGVCYEYLLKADHA